MTGNTFGGSGPRGASGRGGGGRGPGAATAQPALIKPDRGASSRDVLNLAWDYVVLPAEEAPVAADGQTVTAAKRRQAALPREQAFDVVAGEDPRPLLVLRECGWCEGSDDALLSSRFDNEKTILMSQWFHAVKLPNHVLEADHSFRNLFEGEEPPHLFVATRDGRHVVTLDGQQSQSELWKAMGDVMDEVYETDAVKTVKATYKHLDKLDGLDERINRLRADMDAELERKGPGSSKLKSLQRKLAQSQAERDEVKAALDELRAAPLQELGD